MKLLDVSKPQPQAIIGMLFFFAGLVMFFSEYANLLEISYILVVFGFGLFVSGLALDE